VQVNSNWRIRQDLLVFYLQLLLMQLINVVKWTFTYILYQVNNYQELDLMESSLFVTLYVLIINLILNITYPFFILILYLVIKKLYY